MLLAASEGVGRRTPVSLSRSDRGRKGGGASRDVWVATHVSSLESSGNHVPRQLLVLLNDFLGVSRRALAPPARIRPHRTARRRVPILDLILNIIAKEKRRRSARTSRSCLVRRSASLDSVQKAAVRFSFLSPSCSTGFDVSLSSHWFFQPANDVFCVQQLCCVVPRSPRVSKRSYHECQLFALESLTR